MSSEKSQKDYLQLDAVLVNETYLNENLTDPKVIGYSIYRGDRINDRGGGVATSKIQSVIFQWIF